LRAALNFSASEKRGLIVLIVIMFLIIFLPRLYDDFYGNKIDIEVELSYVQFIEQIRAAELQEEQKIFFNFNPNTIDKEGLVKMSIPTYLAERILKYRSAGGQFKKKEDLKKIYGMTDILYAKLEVYIFIPAVSVVKEEEIVERKIQLFFDLNRADSAQLTSLKGIGPVYATRILSFRTSLGGYFKKEQVKEVFGISDSLYVSLSNQIYIDSSFTLKRIKINEVNIKELRKHPYFRNFNLSRSIINYREEHGNYKEINDLMRNKLMTDSIFNKVKPYMQL